MSSEHRKNTTRKSSYVNARSISPAWYIHPVAVQRRYPYPGWGGTPILAGTGYPNPEWGGIQGGQCRRGILQNPRKDLTGVSLERTLKHRQGYALWMDRHLLWSPWFKMLHCFKINVLISCQNFVHVLGGSWSQGVLNHVPCPIWGDTNGKDRGTLPDRMRYLPDKTRITPSPGQDRGYSGQDSEWPTPGSIRGVSFDRTGAATDRRAVRLLWSSKRTVS